MKLLGRCQTLVIEHTQQGPGDSWGPLFPEVGYEDGEIEPLPF